MLELCVRQNRASWPVTGEVLADPFLVVPQQAMEGQNITITDEGQTVVDGVTGRRVGCYIQEKPVVKKQENTLNLQTEDLHQPSLCFR